MELLPSRRGARRAARLGPGPAALLALAAEALGAPDAAAAPPEVPSMASAAPLRFAQRLTGALPGHQTEVRWELRAAGAAPTLQVRKRACPGAGLKATGPPPPCPDDAPAIAQTYRGRRTPRSYGVDFWFEAATPVEGLPQELTLRCLRAVVGVLPAGAMLRPGDACNGGAPPRWQPAQARDVGLWYCEVQGEPAQPWNGYEAVGPLAFAGGAGVEWLFVNNDCAGQEGAYRLPAGAR